MCGLVGVAGGLELKDEALMKRLLLLDFFRGPDSTGMASIRSSGDVHLAKIASHPLDLFDMQRFKTALAGATSVAFIGHNRSATRGLVNNFNAHPFQYEHIIGAHNGTLDYRSVQRLEDAVGEKFGVDSQALFAAIAKLGVEEAISLCEEGKTSTDGAWSLVWFDKERNSLNFLRNKHRPMWYAYSAKFNKIYWASEWRMIDSGVHLGLAPDELYKDGKNNQYFATEEDVHYEYDIDALKKGGDKLIKPKVKALKGKEPAPVTSSGHDPFNRSSGGGGTTSTGSKPSKTRSHSSAENDKIHLEGDTNNPFAGFLIESKFKSMTAHGCWFCNTPITFGQTGLTILDKDDQVLCPDCSGHSEWHNRIYVSPEVFVNVK